MLLYRQAEPSDIPALMEIRDSVRENRLVTLRIGHADYVQALTVEGRTFVCESDGTVLGFSCGRPAKQDVWALFVRPECEGRGIGSALMTLVETWLFEQGATVLTLSTAPGTRAERLYLHRGWQPCGDAGPAERRYQLVRGDVGVGRST
jgi:GNAT superfamily N-acetyltransferase